jgi:hypothetical protein
MTTKNNTNNKPQQPQPVINRRARRAVSSRRRKANKNRQEKIVTDNEVKVVYHDDSFKDKSKRVFSHGMEYVKERLAKSKENFELPESVNTVRLWLSNLHRRTTCLIINRDGRQREFMPDVRPKHKILVHGCVARVMVSKVCMLVRITANRTKDTDEFIDGSWAATPAEWRMINATTIQYVRLRPWFFLRRYWYEITFDGRVQPAHLFYDYEMDPTTKRRRMWITREFVEVAKTDKLNDYFRFWKHKPKKK